MPAPTTQKKPAKIIRVYNRTLNTYTHDEYRLGPQGFADIPESVWEIWKDITHYGQKCIVDANDSAATPASSGLAAQNQQLAAENEKLTASEAELKAKVENLQKLLDSATKPAVPQVAPRTDSVLQ